MRAFPMVALVTSALSVLASIAVAQDPPSNSPTPARAVPRTTSRIAAQATPATVTILAIGTGGDTAGQGSGFIVNPNGTILTNWHVLQGATNAVVILASGERFDRVSFLDGDSATDFAIIKIPGFELPSLRTRSTIPPIGEKVVAIGSPLGLNHTVSEGIVSAVRLFSGKQLVQITAAIGPGSSGGAVLDTYGNVFAISSSFMTEGQLLNFAIPVRYALGLLSPDTREQAIGSVFGKKAAAEVTPLASSPSSRTTKPRSSVYGQYFLDQTIRWGRDGGAVNQAGLLLAEDDVGLLALANKLAGDSLGPTNVYYVASLRTNNTGQTALVAGGVVYDGYQTDDGFYLEGASGSPERGQGYSYVMNAKPFVTKLSFVSGLYNLHVRTFYYVGKESIGDALDWDGKAAIVSSGDSLWIDMTLRNTRGGSSGIRGVTPLRNDGRFDLSVGGGKSQVRLVGSLIAGRLQAAWTDVREKGRFEGLLTGERY